MISKKTKESIVKLMNDLDDGGLFKKSVLLLVQYTSSLQNKPQDECESEQNQITVSMLSLIAELITQLAKQNDRIQSIQSSISQLIVRVNDHINKEPLL